MVKEYKDFRGDLVSAALADCETAGYKASFMPQIVDERISVDKDAVVWKNWYSSVSVRVTGKTEYGSKVVVFAHVPNYFSKSKNIKKAVEQGLVYEAGRMPRKEFLRLVDRDGLKDSKGEQIVFVVDYDTLSKSKSGVIPVGSALEHPMVVPFLGGQKRAIDYLKRHEEVYGPNIGVGHCDDFNEDGALGRLLVVGGNVCGGLGGGSDLFDRGRFRGVRNVTAEGGSQKSSSGSKGIVRPSLDEILKFSKQYVPQISWTEFKKEISGLYHKR